MAIERKPSQLNPSEIKKKSFVPTKSLHIVKKMREWQKINDENRVRVLYRRIRDLVFFEIGYDPKIAVCAFSV